MSVSRRVINKLKKEISRLNIWRELKELREGKRELLKLLGDSYLKHNLVPKLKEYEAVKSKKRAVTNILQVNTQDIPGGGAYKIPFQLFNLLNEESDKGCSMLVKNKRGSGKRFHKIERELSVEQKYLFEYQKQEGLLDFFHLSSFKLKEHPAFIEADIIHLNNLHGDYFSYLALPELTALKPTLWTLHDMQAITGHCAYALECNRWEDGCGECPDLSLYPAVDIDNTSKVLSYKKRAFDNSKLTIVCPSKWLMNMVKNSVLGKHDIRLIYNGVDIDIFRPSDKKKAKEQLGLPLNKKVVIFAAAAGKGNSWKGGRYLEKAIKAISKRNDIYFVSIGAERDKKKGKLFEKSFISDEKELALYYSAADLFIYPPIADNCPLVVLEAMACGTPVIAFRTGGIPELVRHMESGYIANYCDIGDLIKGVELFLDDDDIRRRASENAVSRITKEFSLLRMKNDYVRLYNELAEGE